MLTHPITKRSVAGCESSCSNDLTSAGGSAVPTFHVTMCSLDKKRRHKQSRSQSVNELGSYKLWIEYLRKLVRKYKIKDKNAKNLLTNHQQNPHLLLLQIKSIQNSFSMTRYTWRTLCWCIFHRGKRLHLVYGTLPHLPHHLSWDPPSRQATERASVEESPAMK